MELRRTANAGFLLRLDGVTIAMDGVCLEVSPYQATPPAELARLQAAPPDLLAFTHGHADHFDPAFAAAFPGPIVGPGSLLPGRAVTDGPFSLRGVRIIPVSTRHIGKPGLTTAHRSFIIEGSRRIWFTGDAAPTQLPALAPFGPVQVLIAPFAYATGAGAVDLVNAAAPQLLVLTHLPEQAQDPAGLWPAVRAFLPRLAMPVVIPAMGQTIAI